MHTYILQGMSNFGPQIRKRTWNIGVYFHISGSEFVFLMECTCVAILFFPPLIIEFDLGLVCLRRSFVHRFRILIFMAVRPAVKLRQGIRRWQNCETSCET